VPRCDHNPAMSEQNRWSTVSRCLKDTTMPTDVRAAGALLLFYGLPATRIVELRRDQLVEHDGRLHLVIGQHRAVIPPRLARLLVELPIRPPGTAVVAETSSWQFGGRLAGGFVRENERQMFAGFSARSSPKP
jgi:hypothetical protein